MHVAHCTASHIMMPIKAPIPASISPELQVLPPSMASHVTPACTHPPISSNEHMGASSLHAFLPSSHEDFQSFMLSPVSQTPEIMLSQPRSQPSSTHPPF